MGLRSLFAKDEVVGSRVLVCALGNKFEGLVGNDGEIYKKFYQSTTKAQFLRLPDLIEAIERRYDIVHLFCDVPSSGVITDDDGNIMPGTELIQRCHDANVKLLWIASDNQPDGYIKNFGARGKRISLVMTIIRNDPKFSDFLEKLLHKIFQGETMPVAWESLAPQVPGSGSADSPACIFFAGRGAAKLR
jgi:hypothetical protein